MIRLLTLASLVILLAFGCQRGTCAEERGLIPIREYISNNNIAVQDTTINGIEFFYKIDNPGGEERPNLRSDIRVVYEGRETNDMVFAATSSGDTNRFNMSRMIAGWQLGIPLIGEGGKISLFLPSRLGYGPRGSGTAICPNSDLIFNIELVSFSN